MMPIKLEDQDGNMVDVSQFKGKVIFINFFATWCPPCRAEIPDIEAVYKANGYNKKDVVVVGVASLVNRRARP
ncbi:MAG: TlpA disulfide reductase family protein [Peptostreptococcus anaerobius]